MDLSVGSGLSKIKMSLMTVTDGMAYIQEQAMSRYIGGKTIYNLERTEYMR